MSVRKSAGRALSPAIGVEFEAGVALADADDASLLALRDAIDTHHLVVLRGQHLVPDSLLALTRRFGVPLQVPWVRPMDTHPEVIAVVKEADEQGVSVFGGDWHSDFSSLAEPPSLTLLYAREVPSSGGDTLWSNQVRAWETLSVGLRDMLAERRALHAGRPYGMQPGIAPARRLRGVEIARNQPEADIERPHPVARTHPRTGARALYVNPIYTTRFENMSEAESRPLLDYLYAHAVRPEFCCRLRWTPGTLAIWDNRCTLHYAVNDYDGARREMYRTTVAGETPQ